ncbi:MAG: acetyltransferase [Phycisphaerales bacterium]|jgi:sugar O-acyltransferase (sialic acid O-acetyltransferase NeuD family)|nr:acetyltransferase [Phycisphaerales bacterium]
MNEHGELVLFGAGGHAAVVADAAVAMGFVLVGVVDAIRPVADGRPPFGGVPWLGPPDDPDPSLHELLGRGARVHAAVGDAGLRRRWLGDHADHAACIVHPAAVVSPSAAIGEGVFIGPRAVVNARAVIGTGTIVNTSAILEHDARTGEYCHLAPGAIVLGNAVVGDQTLVGSNATILPAITVGQRATIGAGSVVTSDLPDDVRAFGNPARDR